MGWAPGCRLGSGVLHIFLELVLEEQQLPGVVKSRAETLLRKGTQSSCPHSMDQCRSHGQAQSQQGREAWARREEKESVLENSRIYHTRAATSDARWQQCPF